MAVGPGFPCEADSRDRGLVACQEMSGRGCEKEQGETMDREMRNESSRE